MIRAIPVRSFRGFTLRKPTAMCTPACRTARDYSAQIRTCLRSLPLPPPYPHLSTRRTRSAWARVPLPQYSEAFSLTTHHCINARLSSPPSNDPLIASPPLAPPPRPSIIPPPLKSPCLVWRIRRSLRSTGPFARASCPSCLRLTGSSAPVELARWFPCLLGGWDSERARRQWYLSRLPTCKEKYLLRVAPRI